MLGTEDIVNQNALATLLDSIPAPVYVVRVDDYTVIYQNRCFTEKFGSAVSTKCYHSFQKQDEPCSFCPIPKMSDSHGGYQKSPFVWETLSPIDDRYYLMTDVIFAWPNIGMSKICVLADITYEKLRENDIKIVNESISEHYKSETSKHFGEKKLYETVFENARIGLAATDICGVILSCNSALCNMLGIEDKEKFIHSKITDFMTLDEKNFGMFLLPLIKGDLEFFYAEKQLINIRNEIIHARVTVTVTKDDEHIRLVVFAIEDTTQERVARLSQERQSKLLTSIMHVSTFGICVTDGMGCFTFVNDRYCEIYGYERDELIGNSFLILLPKDCQDRASKIYQAFMNREGEMPSEWDLVTKNGVKKTVFASVALLLEENGVSYSVTSIQDITDQKEQEMMHAQQCKNASMGEMISNIAHQWRQPLSAISSLASSLQMDLEMDKFDANEGKEVLGKIAESVKHLSKTIEDFRNFFRPEKQREVVTLSSIYESVFGIMEKLIEKCGVKLSYICLLSDRSLQNVTIKVNTFPREIAQVIIVILNNALDAFEGMQNSAKTIEIRCSVAENMGLISIQDNAGGILPDVIPKIFDPYFTTKDQSQGTGIGLYMAKKIVEQHNDGKLLATNIDGGTRFDIYLPLAKDS